MNYEIKNYATETEINLFTDVDEGVNSLIAEIRQIKGKIKLNLNSLGGNVFEGIALYSVLNSIKERVEVEVIGIAGSIASVIALCGSKLTMRKGTMMMLHLPYVGTSGNSNDIRKMAEVLDKITNNIIDIYLTKTSLNKEEVLKMMEDETWLNADDCLRYGFADEVVGTSAVAAYTDFSSYGYKNYPVKDEVPFDEVKEEQVEVKDEVPVEEAKEEVEVKEEIKDEVEEPIKDEVDTVKINDKQEEVPVIQNIIGDNKIMDTDFQDKVNLGDISQVQDKVELQVGEFKNALLSKPRNAALTLSDGFGVPTAIGGEILRLRNKKSIFRSAGARTVGVSNVSALTFNPNSSAAEVITGNYTDLTGAGTKITATPSKLGGRYLAKEEVNEFSVLNVMNEFKTDAARAIVKGENTVFMDNIIATGGVGNVAAGDWTQAKIAATYATVGASYLGEAGAWFINSASLPSLMAVQTNGAGSPLLFQPVFGAEDGRVGTLLGQPVYVHASVPTSAAGTKKALWYVAMDALVIVDFNGGNLKAEAGTAELTNDLYINFAEYVFFDVADPAGVVSLTWA